MVYVSFLLSFVIVSIYADMFICFFKRNIRSSFPSWRCIHNRGRSTLPFWIFSQCKSKEEIREAMLKSKEKLKIVKEARRCWAAGAGKFESPPYLQDFLIIKDTKMRGQVRFFWDGVDRVYPPMPEVLDLDCGRDRYVSQQRTTDRTLDQPEGCSSWNMSCNVSSQGNLLVRPLVCKGVRDSWRSPHHDTISHPYMCVELLESTFKGTNISLQILFL